MIALAEIGFGVDGVNAHELHHSVDLLTVDQDRVLLAL